jgi:triosephosphate isomerase
MMKNKIVIANWKMRLSLAETLKLTEQMKAKFKDYNEGTVVICPNFLSLLHVGKELKSYNIKLGAQDVFWEDQGAYTGEISPIMLSEAGCQYAIVGHSERRKFLNENYEMIHKKLRAVLNAPNLIPIICIGENWDERKTDRRDFVLVDQLNQALSGLNIVKDEQIIIAYEPIWAIGSGLAIEPAEAEYAHKIIKLTLNDMFGLEISNNNFSIVYGGSIDSKNVKGFVGLENFDGLLVGGASLKAEEFYKIAKAICK